jgi:hypothetical protein
MTAIAEKGLGADSREGMSASADCSVAREGRAESYGFTLALQIAV